MPGEYAPTAIYGIYEDLDKLAPDLKVQLSGIVGNSAHTFGYHRARTVLENDGEWGDYSIQLPPDKEGDGWAASAIDITPATQDGQHTLTRRLLDATSRNDPRLHPLREWAGSLDSKNVCARSLRPSLTDVSSEFDSSHLWHIHLSILRKFANNSDALALVANVLAGIPLDGSNGGGDNGGPTTVGTHHYTGPKFPLPPGNYFGPLTGPRVSHGGARFRDRHYIKKIQRRLSALGYGVPASGIFGPKTQEAVSHWQHATRADVTSRYGEIWWDDWRALFTDAGVTAADKPARKKKTTHRKAKP